jgi:hypothetical protein
MVGKTGEDASLLRGRNGNRPERLQHSSHVVGGRRQEIVKEQRLRCGG